jgi:hypothetical protein
MGLQRRVSEGGFLDARQVESEGQRLQAIPTGRYSGFSERGRF